MTSFIQDFSILSLAHVPSDTVLVLLFARFVYLSRLSSIALQDDSNTWDFFDLVARAGVLGAGDATGGTTGRISG